MISVIGIENTPARPRSSANSVSTAFAELASPNSPMKKPGCARCASATVSRTGPILSPASSLSPRTSNSTSAASLPFAIWPPLPGGERRADVLNRRHLRDARDDVLDRSGERRLAYAKGAALDQDALARRLLEPGVEDPVHAARLAGPGRVRVDVLRADRDTDGERDGDEREPAEDRGLPVAGAPATHTSREVVLVARHHGSPFR
jgi:hypothetical protein